MIKILKYSFYDLIRSRWSYIYLFFYLFLGFVLLFLNSDLSKATLTLMNIIVVLTPMIGTIFGIMYFYSSREFTELLLSQPIKRSKIFLGQYLGISLSLSMSLIVGLGIPFAMYGVWNSSATTNFLLLLLSGTFLTFIFTAIAIYIGVSNTDKIKGFGYAILMWLFFAVIYDGLFMISLIVFDEYPLDKFALIASLFNPIDLARIMVLLKLEISALLGYTGALFQKFFGTQTGLLLSIAVLLFWVLTPLMMLLMKANKKDF
ncbi:MAG: Cu-processing system permease protein [Cyclobacteriaceae bacterium]|jgi:Cu-processing system permease protein